MSNSVSTCCTCRILASNVLLVSDTLSKSSSPSSSPFWTDQRLHFSQPPPQSSWHSSSSATWPLSPKEFPYLNCATLRIPHSIVFVHIWKIPQTWCYHFLTSVSKYFESNGHLNCLLFDICNKARRNNFPPLLHNLDCHVKLNFCVQVQKSEHPICCITL